MTTSPGNLARLPFCFGRASLLPAGIPKDAKQVALLQRPQTTDGWCAGSSRWRVAGTASGGKVSRASARASGHLARQARGPLRGGRTQGWPYGGHFALSEEGWWATLDSNQ